MAAPAAATPEAFFARGCKDVPDEDVLAAGVPATFSALVTALERWGTMSLREVSAPARELAAKGFAVSAGLRQQHKFGLAALEDKFKSKWPAQREALPSRRRRCPKSASSCSNEALARTLDYLANERDPHAAFYRGDVAAEIAKFSKRTRRLARAQRSGELRDAHRAAGQPALRRRRALQVRLLDAGTGGAADASRSMSRFDLKAHGRRQRRLLPPADRGDEARPSRTASSTTATRSRRWFPARCCFPTRTPTIERGSSTCAGATATCGPATRGATPRCFREDERFTPKDWGAGTVHVDAIDAKGNMASFTPSGAWIKSAEVIGRARLSAVVAHDDVLSRAGAPSERGRARQAAAHHAHALARLQGRASPG